MSANETTLVVAHKLAIFMAADDIAVMAKRTTIEQGDHRELLARAMACLYTAMVHA